MKIHLDDVPERPNDPERIKAREVLAAIEEIRASQIVDCSLELVLEAATEHAKSALHICRVFDWDAYRQSQPITCEEAHESAERADGVGPSEIGYEPYRER